MTERTPCGCAQHQRSLRDHSGASLDRDCRGAKPARASPRGRYGHCVFSRGDRYRGPNRGLASRRRRPRRHQPRRSGDRSPSPRASVNDQMCGGRRRTRRDGAWPGSAQLGVNRTPRGVPGLGRSGVPAKDRRCIPRRACTVSSCLGDPPESAARAHASQLSIGPELRSGPGGRRWCERPSAGR